MNAPTTPTAADRETPAKRIDDPATDADLVQIEAMFASPRDAMSDAQFGLTMALYMPAVMARLRRAEAANAPLRLAASFAKRVLQNGFTQAVSYSVDLHDRGLAVKKLAAALDES